LPFSGWRLALSLFVVGAVCALALPPVHLLPVLPFCLLYLYRCAEEAPSWRGAGWSGFWFGWGFHTAGLYWLTDAILTRVHEFWWVVPIAAPGVALILAPFAAVPAVLCRWVVPGWRRVLVFAGVWTLADMGRVFLFTGFPWNPLGSVWEVPGRLGDVPIQLASVVGVDGLTLLTVLAALLLWQGRRAVVCVLVGLVVWFGFGMVRLHRVVPLPVANPAVVLVQGNVPEREKLSRADMVGTFRRYLALTNEGVADARARFPERPVVFAWPETAFPGLLDEDDIARQMIARAGQGAAYGMIGTVREGGGRESAGGRWFNSVMALDGHGVIVASYDKSTLVPFGEYQPWIVPFNVVPGQMASGHGRVTWRLPGVGSVGPLICYEVIFSGRVVARGARPDWLLNVTNDAWFGDSAGPRQHLASVRMRAVEEGLPIARAANTGISAVYDGLGRERARLGWGVSGSIVVPLPSPLEATVFAGLGRWVPVGLAILCVLVAFGVESRVFRMKG